MRRAEGGRRDRELLRSGGAIAEGRHGDRGISNRDWYVCRSAQEVSGWNENKK